MVKIGRAHIIIMIYLLVFVLSCGKNPTRPSDTTPNIPQKEISGLIVLSTSAGVKSSDLELVTPLEKKPISSDGQFTVNTIESDRVQVVVAVNKDGEPVLLAPITSASIELSAKSTALSLILMNPVFILTANNQREEIIRQAQNNDQFSSFVSDIESLLKNDPNHVLDYTAHPKIYERAALISLDLLQKINVLPANKSAKELAENPWIEDAQGDSIAFYNPTSVYFAGEVFQSVRNSNNIILLDAKENFLSFHFGWPPIYQTEPTRTPYKLGNGSYNVGLTKGFDIDTNTFFDWNSTNGRASLCNTSKGIFLILDLIVGYLPTKPITEFRLNATKSAYYVAKISNDFSTGDVWGVIDNFAKLILYNSEQICYWLWQDAVTDASREFITKIAPIISNISGGMQIISAGYTATNKLIPFFYDLLNGERCITLKIKQSNGFLTDNTLNASPEKPNVWSDYSWGNVSKEITFFTQASDKDNDTISYRFHWGDGTSSPWSSFTDSNIKVKETHSFSSVGFYNIVVEAKDNNDGISPLSDVFTINILPIGITFYYNFDNDSADMLPNNPPWTATQKGPSYLKIINSSFFGSRGNSCAFYDFDPALDVNANEDSYAMIFANIAHSTIGTVEFAWRIEDINDVFGVRVWQTDNYDWEEMGYYVLFQNGNIAYYFNDGYSKFHAIQSIQAKRWYTMKLEYNISTRKYNIYIDGTLKASQVPFVGTQGLFGIFQAVAFSDARCKTAYIDEIKISSESTSAKISYINSKVIPSRAMLSKEHE